MRSEKLRRIEEDLRTWGQANNEAMNTRTILELNILCDRIKVERMRACEEEEARNESILAGTR